MVFPNAKRNDFWTQNVTVRRTFNALCVTTQKLTTIYYCNIKLLSFKANLFLSQNVTYLYVFQQGYSKYPKSIVLSFCIQMQVLILTSGVL